MYVDSCCSPRLRINGSESTYIPLEEQKSATEEVYSPVLVQMMVYWMFEWFIIFNWGTTRDSGVGVEICVADRLIPPRNSST